MTRSTRPSGSSGTARSSASTSSVSRKWMSGSVSTDCRLGDALDRVLTSHPALVQRELDERMQRAQRVGARLGRQSLALQSRREVADVVARDLADRLGSEEIDDVDAQPVRVGLDRRGLAPGGALGGDQRLADTGQRPTLLLDGAPGLRLSLDRTFGRDLLTQPPERRLGFGAGQSLRVALGVHEAEAPLDLPAAVAPLRDPGVALGPGSANQSAAAVAGATLCAGDCCRLPFVSTIAVRNAHSVVPLAPGVRVPSLTLLPLHRRSPANDVPPPREASRAGGAPGGCGCALRPTERRSERTRSSRVPVRRSPASEPDHPGGDAPGGKSAGRRAPRIQALWPGRRCAGASRLGRTRVGRVGSERTHRTYYRAHHLGKRQLGRGGRGGYDAVLATRPAFDEPYVLRSRHHRRVVACCGGRIVAGGLPGLYDGLPIRELSLITLVIARPGSRRRGHRHARGAGAAGLDARQLHRSRAGDGPRRRR